MFRLSVAQSPACLDSVSDRLDWLRDTLPGIAASGAEMVVLPELFLCGYNIGDEVRRRAEPLDGPGFRCVSDLARQSGVAVHYGFAEAAGAALYNAAVCVSPEGALLGHHRKLTIPPGFEGRYFTAGEGCGMFTFRGVRFACVICYDAEFPEVFRHVAALGAQVVLVPTALGAGWSWVARSMIPTRAYENGLYLAYANSAGVENGMAYLGESFIAAPDGVEVARAGKDAEVIHAGIDTDRVTQAQVRLPYLSERHKIKF